MAANKGPERDAARGKAQYKRCIESMYTVLPTTQTVHKDIVAIPWHSSHPPAYGIPIHPGFALTVFKWPAPVAPSVGISLARAGGSP